MERGSFSLVSGQNSKIGVLHTPLSSSFFMVSKERGISGIFVLCNGELFGYMVSFVKLTTLKYQHQVTNASMPRKLGGNRACGCVINYAWAAHAFSAGIKCLHCSISRRNVSQNPSYN